MNFLPALHLYLKETPKRIKTTFNCKMELIRPLRALNRVLRDVFILESLIMLLYGTVAVSGKYWANVITNIIHCSSPFTLQEASDRIAEDQ